MTRLGKRIIFFTLLIIGIGTGQAALREANYYQNFWHPMFKGERLNYCSLQGNKCGLAIADRYCHLMGFARADQQIIAYNLGLTHFIDAQAACKGWQCNGFKTIRCVNQISHNPPQVPYYRLRRFVFPRFNHYRVDWCYDGVKGCGQKAAHSFCRRLGYMKARHFSMQQPMAATQAIGNQKLCFGTHCKAFKEISCYR